MAGGGRTRNVPPEYDQGSFQRIHQDIDARFSKLSAPVQTYTITNAPGSPVRTLDASAATLAELRNFVATLVADLQAAGRLGK